MTDIARKLEERIDSLLAQRTRAIETLRRNYQAGMITPTTDRRQTRINFGILNSRIKKAIAERDSWIARHPS